MKGQVQRKKYISLSELIKGSVLLGFTPSSPRTTLDIPVPRSMLSDNEMTLPLQLAPAEVSALLRRWKQGPAVPLLTHIFLLLVNFISFLIPLHSKIHNLR